MGNRESLVFFFENEQTTESLIHHKSMAVKPTQKEIATKAYLLWEAEGSQPGRDSEYWSRAEVLLTLENSVVKVSRKKVSALKKTVATKSAPKAKAAKKEKTVVGKAAAGKPSTKNPSLIKKTN
jgi:hypothetical protein